MRYVTLMICAIAFSFASQAQSTYEIKNLGTDYSQVDIESALNSADLCQFYFVNNRRKMFFDDGSQVELLSQSELANIPDDCFVIRKTKDEDEEWQITSTGHLLRKLTEQTK